MKLGDINIDNWSYIMTFLPKNLEILALEFLIRKRKIRSIEQFLYMCLAYVLMGISMQSTCVFTKASKIANISQPGFFMRFSKARNLLTKILRQMLEDEMDNKSSIEIENKFNIKIIDATHIQGPGAIGTEWRIHTEIGIDLTEKRWLLKNIIVTDEKKGENFKHFHFTSNDLIIADRGYSTAQNIYYAIRQNTNVLIRLNPNAIRLCDKDKNVIDLNNYYKKSSSSSCYSLDVLIPVQEKRKTKSKWSNNDAIAWVEVRVICGRNKNGKRVWFLTTIPREIIDDTSIIELYRIRWQIELKFKKLKSLGNFNKLRSPHKGPSSMSWIVTHLIVTIIAERMNEQANITYPQEEEKVIDEYIDLNPKQVSEWREFNIALWALRSIISTNCIYCFYSKSAREAILTPRRRRKNQEYPIIPNKPP